MMDGIDWYMIAVITVVAMLAVFFGWTEHIEAMAGCVK